jgi:transcription elongation factor GreA
MTAVNNLNEPNTSPATLREATSTFLASLPQESKLSSQQELNRFVRWFGEKRLLKDLTIPQISDYVEQINSLSKDSTEKLEPVKTFLAYALKKGLITIKLAAHIKIKKNSTKFGKGSKHRSEKSIALTAQGYADLEAELTSLQNERPRATEEIRKAAADKDFRENSPLEAAREYSGRLEGRIRELEESLKKAIIMDERQIADHKIKLGDTIVISDITRNEQITYKLVDAREANPIKGKLSIASPIGKALVGKTSGETIKVVAPAGIIPYKIEQIKQG